MPRNRWFVLLLTVLAVFVVSGAALADGPVDGRAGRAEIRFLEGMIDHHQMALDMANHCLTRASTDEVKALCEAVIAAQTPEIEQMQAWLRDWYGIDYQPMAMVGATVDHSQHEAAGTDHSQHEQDTAAATDHSQHEQGTAAPAGEAGGMCSMMGGEGCAMMGDGGMSGMMGGMMGEGGMGMMGGDMMPMMQMQMMMMQMQMMQMMMAHMGMGGMQGMSGMGMMDGMGGMGMMGEGGMSGMGMMGGSGDPAMQQSAAEALAQTAPDEHSAHHPAAEATPEAMDHSQHQAAPAAEATPEAGAMPGMNMGSALASDPAMTMGMLAGLDRLTGLDYDLAWLEAMIEHHDGAIHMAERIQMWAQHPELQALAENIIRAQSAEIEQMEALIAQLSA